MRLCLYGDSSFRTSIGAEGKEGVSGASRAGASLMSLHRRAMLTHAAANALIATACGRQALAQNVTYTYDALGRIKVVTYPDATITYSYDAAGNRTRVVQTGAPTGTFAANPDTIGLGASSQLSWTSATAVGASIDNGVGSVSPASGGSVSVSPATTKTYTLTLTGGGGTLTKQATVTVVPVSAGTFSASPGAIPSGAAATLSWTGLEATSASIDNGVGPVTPVAGGSVSVSPTVTTTYTLTLTGPGGTITKQATVAVLTGSLSPSPSTINQGSAATLSWTSANATSASIDNGLGPVTPAAGGSVQVSPSATTTYTLTLTGPAGTITKQATVTVTPTFAATIPITGTGPVNLRALADAAGYSGVQNANITFQVASGVTIMGAPGTAAQGGGRGIDTGIWPSSNHVIALALQISGKVYGGGGGGGNGAFGAPASLGTVGGDALYCQETLAVTVNAGGEFKTGGGGGGGGGAWTSTFIDGEGQPETTHYGGGRGGGGFPNGTGGAPGTTSGGGAGQAGPPCGVGTRVNGNGGAGGGAASAGSAGTGPTGSGGTFGGTTWFAWGPAGGGQPGYAIRKNGKAVSVTNNGTIVGTQG